MSETPGLKLYIGGEYKEGHGPTFATYNPANGTKIADIQSASSADIDLAVRSARIGQKIWASYTAIDRQRVLLKAVSLLRERNDEFAALECLDTGKPVSETVSVDIVTGADVLEYYAGLAPSLQGDQIPLRSSSFVYTIQEPLGVVAGIGAWNYPVQIALWKSAPALAAGNAMIFKPSEMTPLSALKLAEIYTEAGLPEGVFNVINGTGPEVGDVLARHPLIQKVSFTGGVETGKKVMAAAGGSSLKDVTMELGGKSALIIFDDCDLERAVDIAMMANFFSSGQVCTNGTRVFVQKTIKEKFEEGVKNAMENIRIGQPMDPETNFGPLVSAAQKAKSLLYITKARQSGAKFLYDEPFQLPQNLSEGFFVAPVVITDCSDEDPHVKEEIFGPVMSILSFETEEEVIHRANNTHYGLAAGVVTNRLDRAHRVVQKMEAGICWVNTWGESPAQMPVGGYKESGTGRENGIATLKAYTQTKSVQIEMGSFESVFSKL